MTQDTKQSVPTVDQAAVALAKVQKAKEDAGEEARALCDAVTALEDRLRNGDRKVTVGDLDKAQQKARHAVLLAESHEGTVAQAYNDLKVAKFHDAAHGLTALDEHFQGALDRHAGPIVAQLTDLLGALVAAHDEYRRCATTIAGVRDIVPGEIPASLSRNHGHSAPYKPGVALPTVDTLIGELLAAAFEHAFGPVRPDRKVRELTMHPLRHVGMNALDLAQPWIGTRTPTYGKGNRPTFVTTDRA